MPTYIGSTAKTETHDSQAISVGDRTTRTFRYNGLYTTLLSALPAKGDTWETGYKVQSATLERENGRLGRMTVVCIKKGTPDEEQEDNGVLSTTVEIDMAQVEVDIRSLLDADSYVCDLAAWEAADPELKQQFKFVNANGGEDELTGDPLTVAKLILRGVETKLVFHPVVTKTTVYDSAPDAGYTALGTVCSAPTESPSGYEYLKIGDRRVQNSDGTWQRVEQWSGAEKWSRFLYSGGAGIP